MAAKFGGGTFTRALVLVAAAGLGGCDGQILPEPATPGAGRGTEPPATPGAMGAGGGGSGAVVLPPGFGSSAGGGAPGGAAGGAPGAGGGAAADPCLTLGQRAPGTSTFRRLTNAEFDRTVHDLLGDTTAPGRGFVSEEVALGFNNNASALTVPEALEEQYLAAAETLAAGAVANLPALMGCSPASASAERACVQQFVPTFGLKAFRRPLQSAEVTALLSFYDAQRARDSFSQSVALLVEAMLLSPNFLYRVELGAPVAAGQSVQQLTPYELASRLSYLVWGTMPDQALFQAAAAGTLATPAEVEAQARRMLADPRAEAAVWDFGQQWLELTDWDSVAKLSSAYPDFTPQLSADLGEEARLFFTRTALDPAGTVESLLTSSSTWGTARLAALYGAPAPTGTGFQRLTLDPTKRSGLLTLGAFLATQAKPDSSDPIHRGKFVREQLFCTQLPQPPPGVADPPMVDPTLTTRERYAVHTSNPSCNSCHVLMDPIGLSFEQYDGEGKYRTTENGKPVDASGELKFTDVDGTFVGAVALGQKLKGSTRLKDCVQKQYFRYAFGRDVTADDACSVAQLKARFQASGYRLNELLLAVTQTDAFLSRRAAP